MTSHEKPWYLPTIYMFLTVDCPELVGIPPISFFRDYKTLEDRITHEGESFLTKTLPSLGKAVDLALQRRCSLTTLSFTKRKGSALPVFMQALLERVFDAHGDVLDIPCTTSICLIRQMCFWCKKIEKGYSRESLRQAINSFIEIDNCLPDCGEICRNQSLDRARDIVSSIFSGIGPDLVKDLYPKHGPGAVAERGGVVEKRRMTVSYRKLEELFRPIPFFASLSEVASDPSKLLARGHRETGCSRTEFVPKDSSGPRTIGLEPAEYMWCQQAMMRLMYDHIEYKSCAKGQVNFRRQDINQKFVLNWRDWDTLDMSKASDRNSLALVSYLFEKTEVLRYLLACRTPSTLLPDGRIHYYRKFAPMGSAVCFPVQAVVYYSLAVSALVDGGFSFSRASRLVFVYGDDIIVPHGTFPLIRPLFESVGLKFNEDKCCYSGKFRESCGLDAYDAQNVTPVRLRHAYTQIRSDTDLIPFIEHANQLMQNGYWASARAFRACAEQYVPALREKYIPTHYTNMLPILAWFDPEAKSTVRFKNNSSVKMVWGSILRAKLAPGEADCEGAYFREYLSHGGPVGTINPKSRCRFFSKRYEGTLRKRWTPVLG